ncbi:MAG: Ig-like domain-containing protein [Pirellulaceae bacterium]
MNGVYEVQVSVSDGQGGSDTQDIQVTVTDANDAPVGVAESYQVTAGQTLVVPANGVLGNDSDEDGDSISAVLVDPPTGATLVLASNGSFSFTAGTSQSGPITFTYQVFDGTDYSATVTVTINVEQGASSRRQHWRRDPVDDPDADSEVTDATTDPTSTTDTVPVVAPPEALPSNTPTSLDPIAVEGHGEASQPSRDESRLAFLPSLESSPLLFRANAAGRLQALRVPSVLIPELMESALPDSHIAVQIDQSVLLSSLEQLRNEAEQSIAVADLMTGTATVLVSAGTIGYVLWTIRAGNLLAFVSATVPAWMTYDPLVVLEEFAGRLMGDAGESLADIATEALDVKS